jgi:hypothetical protein
MSDEHHDIFLRAHTLELETKTRTSRKARDEAKWSDFALVLDCESRTTADLTLTFGFWRFCELRDDRYVCTEEGIFHDDSLSAKEFDALRRYVKSNQPETTEDGCDRMRLYSRAKFIDEVLGMAIQAKALIVGFNLPFDLSRIAVDWGTADNGGWSLILSQWRNPETRKIEPNIFFPRIVIKALNSKAALINSTRAPMSKPAKKPKRVKLWPAARFLDLRTLLWALRNKSYSLKTACKEFDVPGKLDHKPSGRVNLEEIEYCRQDVRAPVDLLNAAKQEYDLHDVEPGPDRMFSPASVAKAYLEKLNIGYPNRKVSNA